MVIIWDKWQEKGKMWKVVCYEVIPKVIKCNTKGTEGKHGKLEREEETNKQNIWFGEIQ